MGPIFLPGPGTEVPNDHDMDMLDTIRHDAAATEAAGRLAPSTVAALVDAGSFKLWVPETMAEPARRCRRVSMRLRRSLERMALPVGA